MDKHSKARGQDYRGKRDPLRTNEPFGPERALSGATHQGRFVCHVHAATRRHFDLRIEVGGTLKSFAVPRGPTLDPNEKRLAVQTEDHPIEYLDFEEIIPEGNYGAGAMIVWDTGRIVYLEGGAEAGIERGKIDFELDGFKLRGRFGLIATGRRKGGEAERQWLLVKKPDAFSGPGEIGEERPESVLSGLVVEALGSKAERARELEQAARAAGAVPGGVVAKDLEPMLCADSGATLEDPNRLYELKLDGVRLLAEKRDGTVTLRFRSGMVVTLLFPEIARALAALPPASLVLDGEIVSFDSEGRPSFQRLGPRIHARRAHDRQRAIAQVPVVFLAFDVLGVGDLDLRQVPLERRKQLLFELLPRRGFVTPLDHLVGDGRALFTLCRERRLEGVVAKRRDGPYRPGPRRTTDWVKIKCEREDDFVVVGVSAGKGSRRDLGALVLGSFEPGGDLVLRGKVGSGLDQAAIDDLLPRLRELRTDQRAARGEIERGGYQPVRPELVVRVRYVGFTDEGRLRAPVYVGLRADVPPESCRVAPPAEAAVATEAEVAAPPADAAVDGIDTRVQLVNQDKVFWPDEGYTKGDLCRYYASVADTMLPFLRGRPVMVVRYPDGVAGKSFYQWNVPTGAAEFVRTLTVPDDSGRSRAGVLIDDRDGLLYVANLGAIVLHVLAGRESSLDQCDFLTVDFDVGQRPLREAVVLALSLRELLDDVGLTGFVKTSGQKGLHVFVPLGPGVAFTPAKLLVELLGRLLVSRHPEIATMERRVDARAGKVYVDTGQTGPSRTIVAPYSVRAYAGATVSTPLAWEELHAALDPSRFDIQTVPQRLQDHGDPMRDLLNVTPDVLEALTRLEQWVRK